MAELADPTPAPKLGDLLASLTDLPAPKVEQFAIVLGVPQGVVEESRVNHPGSIYHVKCDSLSWWIANADDLTWDAVAKALESPGVGERNLAKKIRTKQGIDKATVVGSPNLEDSRKSLSPSVRSKGPMSYSSSEPVGLLEGEVNICELAGVLHTTSSLAVPNPIIVDPSTLTSDEQEDLEAQLSELNKEIHTKFLQLDSTVFKSLRERITVADLVQTLMKHCTVYPAKSQHNIPLLQDHSDALKNATSIEEVFYIINPYYSYFNYELLRTIIDVHGSSDDKERMRQYLIDFSRYCKKVPCVEFYDKSPSTSKYPKQAKLKFKLEYEKNTLKLENIREIKRQIAKMLNIRSSVLFLHSIKDGCTEVTFLVPTFCAEKLVELADKERSILCKEIKMISIEYDIAKMPITTAQSEIAEKPILEGENIAMSDGKDCAKTEGSRHHLEPYDLNSLVYKSIISLDAAPLDAASLRKHCKQTELSSTVNHWQRLDSFSALSESSSLIGSAVRWYFLCLVIIVFAFILNFIWGSITMSILFMIISGIVLCCTSMALLRLISYCF